MINHNYPVKNQERPSNHRDTAPARQLQHKQSREHMTECSQFTETYKYPQKLKNCSWVIGKQKAQNAAVDSRKNRTFHLSFSSISALRKQHYTPCSGQESLMSCRLQLNPHFSARRSLFSPSSPFSNTSDSPGCNAIRKHFSWTSTP